MGDPIRPVKPTSSSFGKYSNLFTTESNRDPVTKLAEILTMPDLSREDKEFLVLEHRSRFRHRRRMAYISLYCLLILFLVVIIGVLSDGLYICENDDENCRLGILKVMSENSNVIIWISGFFTSIVAAYYGSTLIRPTS